MKQIIAFKRKLTSHYLHKALKVTSIVNYQNTKKNDIILFIVTPLKILLGIILNCKYI